MIAFLDATLKESNTVEKSAAPSFSASCFAIRKPLLLGNYQKKGVFEELKMRLKKVIFSKFFQSKFIAYAFSRT